MLYEFKCKVAGTVTMTQPVAERLLKIIGKPPAAAGVFEPQHLPAAISALETAVFRAGAVDDEPAGEDDEEHSAQGGSAGVSLRQRAWPLIDLMKTAQAAGERITWGV
ncbi:MAG TPA: DUF1840 domain-containing protein [Burkholderiaceae bacterium]|jgi:hypothetical protein|nr:DUF1840 domain-containing protein [Burkholderiaceae bacterium]